MRPDFLGLEAFLAIAEWGSFRRAAAHLNLSQTALSHRIKKLEEDVGVRLLTRTTRQISLTPAGSELMPKARRIMDEMVGAFEDLRVQGKEKQTRLVFGCLPTVATHLLPGVLSEFVRHYPAVMLRIADNSVVEIAQKAEAGSIEFGLTIVSANRWDLDIRPIAKESFVLMCRADDPLAARKWIEWADLQGRPLVRISQQTGNRLLIDDALGSRRESMTWQYEVQHLASAVGLVRAGLAISVVPRLTVDMMAGQGLVAVPLRGPSISRTLGVVSRKGVPLSPAAEALVGIFRAHLDAALVQG